MLYGDTMLNVDLERFYAAHTPPSAAVNALSASQSHPEDSDLVESDEHGRVEAIHGYPHPDGVLLPNQVNAALYVIRREALRDFAVPEKPLDFAKHLFPELLRRGVALHGYRSGEYIKDAGTPERLDQVERDVLQGVVARGSLAVRRPAIFLDRDGTINEEVGYISRPEQLKLIPGAAEAIRLLRAAGYRIVVITNQPVIARGECSERELLKVHDYMERELSRQGAFLDGIYYCPHHPDKGFGGERAELKFDCDCRKPNDGMIRQAVRELNLDLDASWLIGDRTVDVQTAQNCGIRSVLLRTGAGGNDLRHDAEADHIHNDLLAAAHFILQPAPSATER